MDLFEIFDVTPHKETAASSQKGTSSPDNTQAEARATADDGGAQHRPSLHVSWYSPVSSIRSLGSTQARPGSLAGLAESRKRNMGQFFTPQSVAAFVWSIATQFMRDEPEDQAPASQSADAQTDDAPVGMWSIIDSSVGTGRLLQFANPHDHYLAGSDPHVPSVNALSRAAIAAGFKCDFLGKSMVSLRGAGFDVAITNPPFSVNLSSPEIKRFKSNADGRFGPRTSARSEHYAIEHALYAAHAVIALVPDSVRDWVLSGGVSDHQSSRLVACFELPKGCFSEEGTLWGINVLVFGPRLAASSDASRTVLRTKIVDLDQPAPWLDVIPLPRSKHMPRMRFEQLDHAHPTIDLPVTGDNRVRVAHDGRKIVLKFACGFAAARVHESVHGGRPVSLEDFRRYAGYRYVGSAKLDLEALIATGDAKAAFNSLLADIRRCGCTPEVADGVFNHLQRRERKSRRQATAFAHTVYDPSGMHVSGGADAIDATALRNILINTKSFFGGLVEKGKTIRFTRQESGKFRADVSGKTLERTFDEIQADFKIQSTGAGWVKVHAGMAAKYPQLAAALRKRIAALGIDKWLTWKFQQHDLIEIALKPHGAICGWWMGLGKTRLCVALSLIGGWKATVVTMPAYLVPEFAGKLKAMGMPSDWWQVIDSEQKAVSLKAFNLISNERLRQPVSPTLKVTYAHRLRRRVGLLLVDEGELMANPFSQQTIAITRVSAKKLVIMTGTPINSYPRDVHYPIASVSGDATAAAPVGFRGPHLTASTFKDVTHTQRGVDFFRDQFITLAWSVREFDEHNREGAKREIPNVRNLRDFRQMLAPHILRRVPREPEVASEVTVPEPVTLEPVMVDFTDEHLGTYLRVADEFVEWWREARDRRVNSSLTEILIRISALITCNANPAASSLAKFGYRGGLTTKQQWVLQRLQRLRDERSKGLFVVDRLEEVGLFLRHAAQRGIDVIGITGDTSVNKRHAMLQTRLRAGTAVAAFATSGVVRAGLDLPEVGAVVHICRQWTGTRERQIVSRACRPQSTCRPTQEFIHHRGSVDDYMAQMVAYKNDSNDAGLDWATPTHDESGFLHLTTIIERMVEDLAKLRGSTRADLREKLKATAS